MRIYKSEQGSFYFSQYQGNGWFCFNDSKPDIYTLNLCPCMFGHDEEKEAWDKAIEVPSDKYAWFNKIAQRKNNYCDVCDFIKGFYEMTQNDLDKQFDHYPYLIEVTKDIINESSYNINISEYDFGNIYRCVKSHMQVWSNDIERVKKYVLEHDIPKQMAITHTMVDVFGCEDTRRSSLLHEFYNDWGTSLDNIITEAIDFYPEQNDFDKRYYYVKDKLNELRIKDIEDFKKSHKKK